jgi:hypothetical protein
MAGRALWGGPGDADLKGKALTATTMARTVHAVIKTGSDYRPSFEGPMSSRRISLRKCGEGASATPQIMLGSSAWNCISC